MTWQLALFVMIQAFIGLAWFASTSSRGRQHDGIAFLALESLMVLSFVLGYAHALEGR